MPKPVGLGEEKADLVLVREEVPRPPGRQDLLKTISAVLGMGAVQKLVLDISKPIQYWRLVPKPPDMPEVPEEVVEEDLYKLARAAEVEEFVPVVAESRLKYLGDAINELTDRGLQPKAFIVKSRASFCTWAGWSSRKTILGLDVVSSGELPEDAVLLVGANEDVIGLSLRLELFQPAPRSK